MCALCHENRTISGMVTLEMAMLLPGIIIWIVWLVFFMIFLLDMSVLKAEAIRLSDEAAMAWDKDAELDTGRYTVSWIKNHSRSLTAKRNKDLSGELISSRLKTRLKERLILTDCKDIKAGAGSQMIIVQGKLGFRWPFSGSSAAGTYGLKFTGGAASPINNWEQWLWIASASGKNGR